MQRTDEDDDNNEYSGTFNGAELFRFESLIGKGQVVIHWPIKATHIKYSHA